MSQLIVHPQHIYATRVNGQQLCGTGARIWFAQHGLKWSDFIDHGITADKLLATGDAFALAVVETAQKMEEMKGAEDGK